MRAAGLLYRVPYRVVTCPECLSERVFES